MKRTPLWLIGVLLFAASFFGVSNASATDAAEVDVLARLNILRASVGAAPLAVDPALSDVAHRWAATMASTGVFVHNPGLASEAPAGYRTVAENIAWGTDINLIDTKLRDSPPHFENMVNPTFDRVGVGVVETGDGRIYVVQNFTAN